MANKRKIKDLAPEDTLIQVQYASRAAKRKNLIIAVKSKDNVCLLIHTNKPLNLSEKNSNKEIYQIDQHIGVAVSGLQGDARVLIDYSRDQAQSYKLTYHDLIPVQKLVKNIAKIYQTPTQFENIRVIGCSLLFIGIDSFGPQIYNITPSGVFKSFNAYALGNEEVKAREYLLYYYESDFPFNDLINLALRALNASIYEMLTKENLNLAYVKSKNKIFKICTKDKINHFLNQDRWL